MSWIAARQGSDSLVLLLANHDGQPARVDARWSGPCNACALEVGSGTLIETRTADGVTLGVEIPAEDVALIRIHTGKGG